MKAYLDTSVLVSLFVQEASTDRARAFAKSGPSIVVSDFAIAEFSSAMARRVRMREIPVVEAREMFATFDAWLLTRSTRVETSSVDIAVSNAALRRLDLPLRTPDAINISIAQRVGASLATFDKVMAKSARALGLDVVRV